MGKISQYTQALAAKLTDLFVVAQDDNGTLTTKSVSGSQLVELVQDNTTANDIAYGNTTIKEAIDEKATVVDLGRLDNTTKTLTFSTTVRFLVFSFGGSDGRLGGYVCFGRATTSYAQPLLTSSVVTVTPNDNTISITTSTTNVYVSLVVLYGSTDDFVIT